MIENSTAEVTALTGRIVQPPAAVLRENVLEPQFRYEAEQRLLTEVLEDQQARLAGEVAARRDAVDAVPARIDGLLGVAPGTRTGGR